MCRTNHVLLLLNAFHATALAFPRVPHPATRRPFETISRPVTDRSLDHRRNCVRSSSSTCRSPPDVPLYDGRGVDISPEEIDAPLELFHDDDGIAFVDVDDVGDTEENERRDSKKSIECRASIALPFPAEVAFDAFSDLTRQPSWCNYLESVEYIGSVHENVEDGPNRPTLRRSKWTVAVKGLRFTWTARDTCIVRPHRIEWESTSGMKNRGSVEFTSRDSRESEQSTTMTLRFTFVTPRIVSSLFRRSTLIRRYTEEVLLMNMLTGFRDVVLDEDMR